MTAPPAAGGPDDAGTPAAGGSDGADDGVDRRTLIRLLIGLAFGVPLLIEGLTFLGLVGEQFGDGDGSGTDTGTETASGVEAGDELLPATAPTETVADAYVAEANWTFTMVVQVDNGGDRTYDLRLGAVTTGGGDRVDGGAETGPIPPGESASLTARWQLPAGASPAAVDVVAVSGDGTTETVEERVSIGKVPVRG